MSAILVLVIYIMVAGLIFSVAWWGLGALALAEPFNRLARGVLIILAVIILIYLLLGILPPLHRIG